MPFPPNIENSKGLTIVNSAWLTEKWDDSDPEAAFLCLQGPVLAAFMKRTESASKTVIAEKRRVILNFERFLRVIGEPPLISTLAFTHARFNDLQKLFYGALSSKKFLAISQSSRISMSRHFYNIVIDIQNSFNAPPLNYIPRHNLLAPIDFIQAFEALPLVDTEVERLKPYLLVAKNGGTYNVNLRPMSNILGDSFTNQFHNGLCEIARQKAKDSGLRDFANSFTSFLVHKKQGASHIKATHLQDSQFVQMMLVDFMQHHFLKFEKNGEKPGALGSLQKSWSRYINYWKMLSNKNVVAAPSISYPAGKPSLMGNNNDVKHQQVRKADDGTSETFTHKLITPIPLHITDEEATKLIFEQLKKDFEITQRWLRNYLKDMWDGYAQGLLVIDSTNLSMDDTKLRKAFSTKGHAEAMNLAVKYFHERHNHFCDTTATETLVYPTGFGRDSYVRKTELARLLGIPGRTHAMSQMAFLSSLDGRFSESALGTAILLDRHGNRINAVTGDAGVTLSISKARDASDGRHDVVLDGEAAESITKWITLTTPLRNYMRKAGIPGWQNLFVWAGSPMGNPTTFDRSYSFTSSFAEFSNRHSKELGHLANYLSISRIRATRGIMVFLEKMDIRSMALELGNTPDTSMHHYLPESIWQYFANRWIRIFQNLIIIEATKNTPYLHKAMRFDTPEELDQFMKTHAVKSLLPPDDIVEQSAEPYQFDEHKQKLPHYEVMISASQGIFSALLSVKAAVETARKSNISINTKALYWSEFASRLEHHIRSKQFNDRSIKKMLESAYQNIDSTPYMKIVCHE